LASRPDIPPDTLLGGKIRLIKRIGRGGMGDVWLARNEATQAELAVKTLQRAERTPEHDERFRREARLSATISHRNVVRVFDLVDESDGTLGLVMELLHGGTLEECMKERGPLTSVQVLSLALPVLSAMHHVHQKGIIHRDMKPANVFFAVEPDGHVIPKILDFGIAKLPAAGSALTVDGNVLGTPHYMSPEQIRGQENIDGRSDMFSVAVVLFEALTGVRVFQRDTAAASLAAVLEHEVDPDPRIDPRLWVAISRSLAKRPYERYGTCAEFADALRACVSATEEELTQALQELRPRTEVLPQTSTTSNSSIALSSDSAPQVEPKKRSRAAATVAIAVGTATLAVGLTLMFTRGGGAPASTNEPAASASPRLGSVAPPPSPAVPDPPPAAARGAAADEPIELGPSPSKPATTRRHPVAAPHPKPAPTHAPAAKPKPSGGLATTPGF
jgi:serine/threonine-protein kinase